MMDREVYKSINLTQNLTEIFISIGETAFKSETPFLCNLS